MRNLAIIPIRSGSKRLVNKNIKLIAGHPLFYYQVKNALDIKDIHKILVVSDSSYYLDIASKMGIDVLNRSAEVSGDDSKTEEVMLFTIKELEKIGDRFDNIVLLQATNPLTRVEDIQNGIDMMQTGKFNSIISYYEDKCFRLSDEDDMIKRPMMQDKLPMHVESGNFWITKIEEFKRKNNRICKPCGYIRVPFISALEIDTLDNMLVVERLLERKVRINENKYFGFRTGKNNFEDFYEPRKDPDGNTRDLRLEKEKAKKIHYCKNEINFINNLYEDESGRTLLDLGCGLGYASSAIDNRWNKYGLEVSKDAVDIASKYISHVHMGCLESDTYPMEFFDAVFCYHVFEHVEDPINLIKNVQKIMKTHGHLILSTPNYDSALARRFGDNYRMFDDETHVSFFNDVGIRHFLEDFGFQVNRIDYPYFDTEFFTPENLSRLFDTSKVSPPFYGNIMTVYSQKK